MSPSLSVVASADGLKHETVADRVRRLQAEARGLASDHIHSLTAAMQNVRQMAVEIAEGGEAYPAGVRDIARRFAEECDARVQSVEAIAARGGHA